VFRREFLAGVASGIGWQGLSEIYRESIVARAPETLRFPLRVPARPRFDFAVGTPEERPLTFRVAVARADGSEKRVLLDKTVTRPHRWEEASVDLGPEAGRDAVLSLSLLSDTPGTIGFWGAPTLRSRDALPPPQAAVAGARPQGVILVWADTL